MRPMMVSLSLCVVGVLGSQSALGAIAFNDNRGGTTPPGGKFVTNYGIADSGSLVDYDSGSTIATYTGAASGWLNTSGGSIGSSGTPMYNHFNGFLDLSQANYGNTQAVMTFSGLDPNSSYTVTVAINRDTAGPGGQHWYQEVTIGGVDAFTNTSTLADIGINSNPDTIPSISGPSDPSTYITANNNVQANPSTADRVSTDGAIVQFSDIDAGADGTFTLTLDLTQGGNQYINGFSLEQVVPEPASLGLLGLGGLCLLRRRQH